MRALTRSTLILVLLSTAARAEEPGAESAATQPAAAAAAEAPFSPAQLEALGRLVDEKVGAAVAKSKPRYTLGFDVFIKSLFQNDQSNGSTWLGNPHPAGDNYSGMNGAAGTLGIRIDGRVTEQLSAGGRLETRFGQLFADFYESGDLAVDSSGTPAGVDASSDSLGMNHAAYAQLRGLYIQYDKPELPTVTALRAGSSGLDLWNPWTVGRVRFIDRDNAKGFFILGALPGKGLDYNLARVALPKLYGSAGFNTGIADDFVENPFWGRDAVYAGKLRYAKDKLDVAAIASYILDEEADINDPDALGSTNMIDEKDGVVVTIPRYQNLNATLEATYDGKLRGEALLGYSYSDPDLDLVENSIDNNQGLSPMPLTTLSGYAIRARLESKKLLPQVNLRAEYFNIGEGWVATMGQRREGDVLLTEGFLDGQLPTLNLANELIDITEPFYESIIGWHGATLKPLFNVGPLEAELEGTAITYNSNAQDRCTSKNIPGCESGGVYPDFLYPDGMTDTDFFTYANTNDRGRDPRAVYKNNQNRFTWLFAAKGALRFAGQGDKARGRVDALVKLILDKDLRDQHIVGLDDYQGTILTATLKASYKATSKLTLGGGAKLDSWDETHRSGAVVAGVPHYPDYQTFKTKLWLEGSYALPAGANFSYRVELLNKDVDATDDALDFRYSNVVRSIAMLWAGF